MDRALTFAQSIYNRTIRAVVARAGLDQISKCRAHVLQACNLGLDRGEVLFGDGAGALLLEAQDGAGTTDDRGILSTDLNSDGTQRDLLYVDGGTSTGTTGYLRMQGNQVFRHAVEKLSKTATTAMETAGIQSDDVDWIVPHQANIRIIQGTTKKLGLPMDKVVVTVQDHGNTSAASIPLAMSVGVARGQIKQGDLIVTEAIGGGLAWGAVVLRW